MQISFQQVCPVFLEVEKINKSQFWNVDHEFMKGEKIQIIAESGNGKTSLIHFLIGLRKDYSGNILFDKKSIADFSPEKMADYRSNQLSIVFQDLRLFEKHTVYENIYVKKVLSPLCKEDTIVDMAEFLGIANKLNQPAGICSYGEQQRIAIIRALQQPFDFIILDEPFSHLDEANSKKAMKLIEVEVQKRNAGILITDLQEVPFFKAHKTLQL